MVLCVQEHPRATQAQTQEEVARQIELFKQKIETFWNIFLYLGFVTLILYTANTLLFLLQKRVIFRLNMIQTRVGQLLY